MRKISVLLVAGLMLATTVSCKNEATTNEPETATTDTVKTSEAQRIITLNSAITEIVSALGHQKEIVGVDVTSTYPEDIKTTAKDLGHTTQINAESLIGLKPNLVLGTTKDINPELAAKLKEAGVTVKIFDQTFTIDGTKSLIAEVAASLNHKDFSALQNKIDEDLKKVQPINPAPKVLFIYARGANMMMVSGTGTAEDKVINMAGAKNAVADFADFKPLTPEALIKNNPDAILLYETGFQSLGGADGLLKIPGVDKTNAGKNKNFITMDGGLVHAFGPRVGDAAVQLNTLLLNKKPADSAK